MRPNYYDFRPISVPAAWTAALDLEYFIDRFGESKEYFAQAIAQVHDSYQCLDHAVNRAMTYLGCPPKHQAGASLWAKLAKLENRLAEGMPSQCYHDGCLTEGYRLRLEYDLRYCRFGLGEHERLVPNYDQRNERTWLMPIASLADHLMSAAMTLEESMECEHVDFIEKMGKAS